MRKGELKVVGHKSQPQPLEFEVGLCLNKLGSNYLQGLPQFWACLGWKSLMLFSFQARFVINNNGQVLFSE